MLAILIDESFLTGTFPAKISEVITLHNQIRDKYLFFVILVNITKNYAQKAF